VVSAVVCFVVAVAVSVRLLLKMSQNAMFQNFLKVRHFSGNGKGLAKSPALRKFSGIRLVGWLGSELGHAHI